jgi:hypothetical protein
MEQFARQRKHARPLAFLQTELRGRASQCTRHVAAGSAMGSKPSWLQYWRMKVQQIHCMCCPLVLGHRCNLRNPAVRSAGSHPNNREGRSQVAEQAVAVQDRVGRIVRDCHAEVLARRSLCGPTSFQSYSPTRGPRGTSDAVTCGRQIKGGLSRDLRASPSR